jgi:hypothetical protein
MAEALSVLGSAVLFVAFVGAVVRMLGLILLER